MSQSIEEKVLQIIKTNIDLEDPSEEIGLEDDLLLLGINSISFVKIVVALEDEFDMEFDDEDLDYSLFRNANILIDYIKKNSEIGDEVDG